MIGTTVPPRRRDSRLARAVAPILILLLAMLVSYALWTVYENTLTAAAMHEGGPKNTKPSARGRVSPTAAQADDAHGREAACEDAAPVGSTVPEGGHRCPR